MTFDAAGGFPLPAIQVRGIAPDVTVIPVKVLSDHQVPALPKCTDPGPQPSSQAVFGTSAMVAAGIRYATDLKRAGYSPMVINMSLGGSELEPIEKDALDYAIANGVIVVAAAGNDGEAGMHFPGAYAPVISAGAIGWTDVLNGMEPGYKVALLATDLMTQPNMGLTKITYQDFTPIARLNYDPAAITVPAIPRRTTAMACRTSKAPRRRPRPTRPRAMIHA